MKRSLPRCAAWLAPFLAGKTRLDEIGAEDLDAALDALLPWDLKRRLDEAPERFVAPTGKRHAIDYDGPAHPPCTSACRSCSAWMSIPPSRAESCR